MYNYNGDVYMKKKVFFVFIAFLILFSLTSYAEEDTYIVKFKNSIQLFSMDTDPRDTYTEATRDEVEEYIKQGIVEYYEPNLKAVLHTDSEPWNLVNTNASFTRSIEAKGNGITVGVIDSGIREEVLNCKIIPGYDYHEKTDNVYDEAVHGTIVSHIIADFSEGIASECSIVPLKCFYYDSSLERYTANAKEVADAIYGAVNDYKCDVINMSFGITFDGDIQSDDGLRTMYEAVRYAASKGVIMVASAGNEGIEALNYPAAFDEVIGVGAVGENNVVWEKSQHNASVFAVAPGENVPVSITTAPVSGTSFSAPHVSALAAVAKKLDSQINTENFKTLLINTCTDLGEEKRDNYYGNGLINFRAAFKALFKGNLFISPVTFLDVRMEDGSIGAISKVTMYNNTDEVIKLDVLYASYDDENYITDVIKKYVEWEKEKIQMIWAPYSGGTVSYMAWDGENKLVPIADNSKDKR